MKVFIWSIFLPRIELFYIEEWVEHNLSLGIDKIYLYNNGFYSEDNSVIGNADPQKIRKEEQGIKWSKKPSEDYNLDLNQEEIMKELDRIERKYKGKVEIKNWEFERAGSESVLKIKNKNENISKEYPGSQFKGCKHIRESLKELEKLTKKTLLPDYWLFIDIDEFIMLHEYENIKSLILEKQPNKCLFFHEVLFSQRKNKEPVREIFEYGYEPTYIGKSLIKEDAMQRFAPHIPKLKGKYEDLRLNLNREEAEVFHYRGFPWGGKIRDGMNENLFKKSKKLGKCKEVEELIQKEFSKINTSMKKYLNTEKPLAREKIKKL